RLTASFFERDQAIESGPGIVHNSTKDCVKMRGKKIVVLIISLALLLAGLVALRRQREKPTGPSVSENPRLIGGRGFEVQVEMPTFNSGRAPWEIPGAILGYDRGPRFDQASPGAQVGKIAPDHIELSADGGWDLLIETDAEGRLAPKTHVAFPVKLGGRPLKFNCRPADPTVGYLHTTARPDSDELEGNFHLEIAICKNAVSGKTAAWPYQPLKVRGSFVGLKALPKHFGFLAAHDFSTRKLVQLYTAGTPALQH
ncbi:MAG TPA: hypothetical protein VN844_14975, partial [Pyrinomonadaceae bacterium]|nr:hypothetical protein [Pyrinomonadaceae bacterium]